jgi:predicted ATP-dependent serine protease
MSECIQASKIEGKDPRRAPTGVAELDWLLGSSTFSEMGGKTVWGMPEGGISLISGQGGVGKSRVGIELSKFQTAYRMRVLYFQTEMSLITFRGKIKNSQNLDHLFCCNATSVDEQIDTIHRIEPHLVINDSVNQIAEYGGGTASKITTIIDKFRGVALTMPIHIIFLAQLNKDGSTKGSAALPHLVDTEIKAMRLGGANFAISLGEKHRFGPVGKQYWTEWKHFDDGVKCISNNRLGDRKWCETHNLSFPPKK